MITVTIRASAACSTPDAGWGTRCQCANTCHHQALAPLLLLVSHIAIVTDHLVVLSVSVCKQASKQASKQAKPARCMR